MVKEIPLQNGMVALVDEEDYERCMEHLWFVSESSSVRVRVQTSVQGEIIGLARFVLGEEGTESIITLKGDRLDFRKSNLFVASVKEKMRYSRGQKNSTSKYKGVSWDKRRKKWVSQITFKGRNIHLGRFDTEEAAAKAYNQKVEELYGGYGRINTIGENNNSRIVEFERSSKPRKLEGATSKYRGVSFHKRANKWRAGIKRDGKYLHLGLFVIEEQAAKAYDEKAKELHGDKAILNFPELEEELTC